MVEELSRTLGRIRQSHEQTHARARETPNAANQVQYPEEFNSTVPVIIAAPLQKWKINTIIIATQSKGYTEESFRTDVERTNDYFELQPGMYEAILLKPVLEDLDVLDAADATDKLRRVVDTMNRNTVFSMSDVQGRTTTTLPSGETRHNRFKGEIIITTSSEYTLRIVSLGVATSGFIFTALEYIVNGWRAPKKKVQYVTNGEMELHKVFNFWSSACVNELVDAVQFVYLPSYLPFGYYKGKCKKLNKTNNQLYTDQPAEPSALTES